MKKRNRRVEKGGIRIIFITLVIPRFKLTTAYPGGLGAFMAQYPNAYEKCGMVAISLMATVYIQDVIEHLQQFDLIPERDFGVCDEFDGPLITCQHIEFYASRPDRAVDQGWKAVLRSGETPMSTPDPPYPYLVVRIYAAVYQREDINIREGDPRVHIGHRSSFLSHPRPYTDDGQLSPVCRQMLIAAVLETVRRTGFRMCIVWSPDSCTYCELDGSAKDSGVVPQGGLGTGGVGGQPLPGNT
jgi:hypothetical protein